ncbi:MAG: signal peptidase I [Gaiellaceae bacterium]
MTRRLTRLLAGALGLVLLAAGWLFFGPTQVGGTTSYAVIVGNSMEPTLQRGDLAVIRKRDSYRPGDVVLYESAQLGAKVLHRIVRVEGSRFVLKGDNNSFLDDEQPTDDRIIGTLWINAPKVGLATEWLREPLNAALLVGLSTMLALGGGVGVGASRRRRRRPRAQEESLGAPASTRADDAGPDPLPLLGAAGVALLLCAGVGILAFTRPSTTTEPVAEAYVHQGRLEYSSDVRRSAVYPDGRVSTGDPVFLRLVPALKLSFDYRVESRAPVQARGRVRLDARISDGRGWERVLPVGRERAFEGPRATVAGTLDLAALQRLTEELRALTGSGQVVYTVSVLPRVTVTGQAGRDPIDATFAPALDFELGDLRLQPKLDGSGAGLGPFSPREAGSGTRVVAGRLELGPLALPVRTARRLSLIGLVASFLLGLLALVALAQRNRAEEHVRIEARHGHLLLPVAARSQEWSRVTDLEDVESLVRLAGHRNRMVLHLVEGGQHSYLVEDGSSVFRYRTGVPAPAPPPPPAQGPTPKPPRGVEPEGEALVGSGGRRFRARRRFGRRRCQDDW